ncbi:unnamed protein product [Symbiodinium microadriaticum]|nr:unnamed protein product [Symbiodinium microadriaticum]
MEADNVTAFDGYVAVNATLKALRAQRVAREAERNWERPEMLYLAGESSPALRLCSVPGLHLGARVWSSGQALAEAVAQGRCPELRGARCLELGAGLDWIPRYGSLPVFEMLDCADAPDFDPMFRIFEQ